MCATRFWKRQREFGCVWGGGLEWEPREGLPPCSHARLEDTGMWGGGGECEHSIPRAMKGPIAIDQSGVTICPPLPSPSPLSEANGGGQEPSIGGRFLVGGVAVRDSQ